MSTITPEQHRGIDLNPHCHKGRGVCVCMCLCVWSPILNVMWDEWHNNIFPSVHTLCLNAYPLCHISTPPNLRYAHSFRDNNIEECGLEMFFSCDFEVLGVVKSHELTVGGATKQVTEKNKNEYIELVLLRRCGQWLCHDGIGSHRLLTQWRFKRGVEVQMKAFMDGFSSSPLAAVL